MNAQPAIEFLDAVTSDLAFVARGATREAVFAAAAEAVLAATVEDPATVGASFELEVELEEPDVELLLLAFLNELVYRRDAQRTLLRVGELHLALEPGAARLRARLVGDTIDPARHRLALDVKAATAHGLRLRPVEGGWEARVTLDV